MKLKQIIISGIAILFASSLCAAERIIPDSNSNLIKQHLFAMHKFSHPKDGVKFVLQQSHIWHAGNSFKNSNNWLALTCNQQECKLSPAKLEVQAEDWQGHYDEHPTKGQRLTFSLINADKSQVVAWFKTQSAPAWLKPGSVATYQSPLQKYTQPPMVGTLDVRVNLPKDHADLIPMVITLKTLQRIWPEQRHYYSIKLLQLREKGQRQLLLGRLGACHGFESDSVKPENYLRWAGDLDRDGQADYLISFIDEEGDVHLYLSGNSTSENLVGLSGVYRSPPWSGECSDG